MFCVERVAFSKARRALTTRFDSSAGTVGSEQVKVKESAGEMVISSARPGRRTMRVSMSWKPSSRLPRTRRERLSLAGAVRVMVGGSVERSRLKVKRGTLESRRS